MRSTLVSVAILALCSLPGLAATTKPVTPPPARHLPVPGDISLKTRQALRARLGQHATSMQSLVRAVILLDRPTIKLLADRIVDDETFDPAALSRLNIRPDAISGEAEFVAAARELAFVAATGRDDGLLADRFAVLTRTCVSCHGHYLHGSRMRPPIDTEPLESELQP